MSQHARPVRPLRECEECGGRSFSKSPAGFSVCLTCGVQQRQAEEKHEYDDTQHQHASSQRRIALLKVPHSSSPSSPPRADPIAFTLHESRLLLETFHFLLRRQTAFLISRLQAPPELYGVVGRVWLGYLDWWRREGWGADDQQMIVFTSAPGVRKNQKKEWVREQMRKKEEDQARLREEEENDRKDRLEEERRPDRERRDEEDDDEGHRDWGRKKDSDGGSPQESREERRKRQKRRLGSAPALEVAELSMPLSLAILFLSLQSCRHPLTMHILHSLARIDVLPYLAFVRPSRLPSRLSSLLQTAPSVLSFFRPSVIPTAPTLHALSSHVSHCLGLSSPAAFPIHHKHPTTGTAASRFVLHPLTFHPALTALMYCQQMQVPQALTGLVLGMLPLWEELMGGQDEVTVMVCVLMVVKMVYGLDRAPDGKDGKDGSSRKGKTRGKKRRREEAASNGQQEQQERVNESKSSVPDSDDQHIHASREQDGEDEEGSAQPAAERVVVEVRKWQSETEMSDYEFLRQMQKEEEEERQRNEREAARLASHCTTLCNRLASSCHPSSSSSPSPPPDPSSLHGDLVRLFHRPTFFLSSFTEARRYPVECQADLLRFWNDAVLPPSLSLDGFQEFIDKIRPLAPSPPSSPPSCPVGLSSLFSLLSSSFSSSSSSLRFSSFTLYPPRSDSTRFHPDYHLVLYAASLLCGEGVERLDRRIRRFALALYSVGKGKGKRPHSVWWKRGNRVEEVKRRRQRREERRKALVEEEAEEAPQRRGQEGPRERDDEEEEEEEAEDEEDEEEAENASDEEHDEDESEADNSNSNSEQQQDR